MRRRDVLALLGGTAALPFTARACAAQPFRVGIAAPVSRTSGPFVAFQQRMAELGYRDGENYVFDYVQALPAKLEDGWREVASRKPDVLIAGGPEFELKLAMAASATTPIVMLAIDFDPIARGYIAGLARPGGRITGIFMRQLELAQKRLRLFKDAFPATNAATVFWDSISADQWGASQIAGAEAGIKLIGVDLGPSPPAFDYEAAINKTPPDFRGTLVAIMSPALFYDRSRLVDFCLRNRMASVFGAREFVDSGGLMSYGANIGDMWKKAAEYVAKIAGGATPADLPVEQPTKYELVVNLRSAARLGLEIPHLLLARADDLIE